MMASFHIFSHAFTNFHMLSREHDMVKGMVTGMVSTHLHGHILEEREQVQDLLVVPFRVSVGRSLADEGSHLGRAQLEQVPANKEYKWD